MTYTHFFCLHADWLILPRSIRFLAINASISSVIQSVDNNFFEEEAFQKLEESTVTAVAAVLLLIIIIMECKFCKQWKSNIKYKIHTPLYCTTAPDVEGTDEKYVKSYRIQKKSLNYITPEKAKTFFEFMKK